MSGEFDEDKYLTSCYNFCRYLEQNGIFDRGEVEDLPSEGEEGKDAIELQKAMRRSGAMFLLDVSPYKSTICNSLINSDVLVRVANDVAVKTRYWRIRLGEEFGYTPMYREGIHSNIDYKYIPTVNLSVNKYRKYRRGNLAEEAVLESYQGQLFNTANHSNLEDIFDTLPNGLYETLFKELDDSVRIYDGYCNVRGRVFDLFRRGEISEFTAMNALNMDTLDHLYNMAASTHIDSNHRN